MEHQISISILHQKLSNRNLGVTLRVNIFEKNYIFKFTVHIMENTGNKLFMIKYLKKSQKWMSFIHFLKDGLMKNNFLE